MATTALADVLAAVLADGASVGAAGPSPDDLADLRAGLDDAARAAAVVGGWTAADPLRLSKSTVRRLLTCPRQALSDDDAGDPGRLVIGLIVDAAAKLASLAPSRPVDLPAALALLVAQGDTAVADHLADLGDAAGPLLDDAAARVDAIVRGWPRIDAAWSPRIEEPARVALAGGAVTVTGRLDVVLGGPPGDRPAVVVEIKSGRWYDGMRADAHLYALLAALRDRRSPAAVVTVVADGTTQVERVRASAVAHAAERIEAAIQIAAPLAAGEAPATSPGHHCGRCPVRPDCEAGRAWLAGADGPRPHGAVAS